MNNRIKELRLMQHLSQEQLAEKAHVSVRTIQRLEAGDDASISTINLVAGALGVEIADLFTKQDSSQQKEKVKSAAELLEYQLYQRHQEYRVFTRIYVIVYIVVMMAWGTVFPIIHNNSLSALIGICWLGAWVVLSPLKTWLTLKVVNPRLDQKYPLTVNRIDKNKEPKLKNN